MSEYWHGRKGLRIKVARIDEFHKCWRKNFKKGDKRTIAEISGAYVKTKEEMAWFYSNAFEMARPKF